MSEQKLIKLIEFLGRVVPELKEADPQKVAQWIDAKSKSQEGQRELQSYLSEFEKSSIQAHKWGGKVAYLKCLKKGGNIEECGCGKKIPAAKDGDKVKNRVDVKGTAYINEDGNKVLIRDSRDVWKYDDGTPVGPTYDTSQQTTQIPIVDREGNVLGHKYVVEYTDDAIINYPGDLPGSMLGKQAKYRDNPTFLQKVFGWRQTPEGHKKAFEVNFPVKNQRGGKVKSLPAFQGRSGQIVNSTTYPGVDSKYTIGYHPEQIK